MLAVLSEDAALCHYCAPALIIDSIKMAVKLDVVCFREWDAESQKYY